MIWVGANTEQLGAGRIGMGASLDPAAAIVDCQHRHARNLEGVVIGCQADSRARPPPRRVRVVAQVANFMSAEVGEPSGAIRIRNGLGKLVKPKPAPTRIERAIIVKGRDNRGLELAL